MPNRKDGGHMKKKEKCKPFAENLTRAREKAGISRKAFSDALGITQQGLSQYEMGAHEPGLETLCRMADLCNTSTDELLGHHSRTKDDVERLHDVFDGLLEISYAGPGDDEALTPQQRAKVRAAGIVYASPFHAGLAASESEMQERAREMLALPAADFLNLVRGMIRDAVAPVLLAYLHGMAKARKEMMQKEEQQETTKAKKAKENGRHKPAGKKG